MELERIKQTLADKEMDIKELQMSDEHKILQLQDLKRQLADCESSLAHAEKTIGILNQDLERRHDVNLQMQREKETMMSELTRLRQQVAKLDNDTESAV
jgi:chromosome segregation ATPase